MYSPSKKDVPKAAEQAYLARQPIFDASLGVVAYELLFRDGESARALFQDGDAATATLINNTFLEIGLEKITGGKLAFINLTHDYLCGDLLLPLDPRQVVLEVLESVEADAPCLAGIEALRRQGFALALDDFVLDDRGRALLPFASIVKIDVLALDRAQVAGQVKELERLPVTLLAEKVESEDDFLWCREQGFEWFQGYFFARPRLISGRKLPPNQVALLEVIARLQAPDCDIEEVERLISQDIAISYKLLKVINSSFYGLGYKVNSIQHALIVLGFNTLRKWVLIMSLAKVSGKPAELIDLSLIRARMCERLAKEFQCRPDEAFTVGLFSLLDVLMDQNRRELISALPLADEIAEALIEGSGRLGTLLHTVTAYESGNWDLLARGGRDGSQVPAAYYDALAWTWDVKLQLGT